MPRGTAARPPLELPAAIQAEPVPVAADRKAAEEAAIGLLKRASPTQALAAFRRCVDADGDACTVGDVCKDKVCLAGSKKPCDDGELCTADSCDPTTGGCAFAGGPQNGKVCDADGMLAPAFLGADGIRSGRTTIIPARWPHT